MHAVSFVKNNSINESTDTIYRTIICYSICKSSNQWATKLDRSSVFRRDRKVHILHSTQRRFSNRRIGITENRVTDFKARKLPRIPLKILDDRVACSPLGEQFPTRVKLIHVVPQMFSDPLHRSLILRNPRKVPSVPEVLRSRHWNLGRT